MEEKEDFYRDMKSVGINLKMEKENNTEKTEKKRKSVCWNLKEVNKEIEAKNPKPVKKLKTFLINFSEDVQRTIYYEGCVEAETEEEAKKIFFENPFGIDNIDEKDNEDTGSFGVELESIEEDEYN